MKVVIDQNTPMTRIEVGMSARRGNEVAREIRTANDPTPRFRFPDAIRTMVDQSGVTDARRLALDLSGYPKTPEYAHLATEFVKLTMRTKPTPMRVW